MDNEVMKIDASFKPFYLFKREFERGLTSGAARFEFAVERPAGFREVIRSEVLPEGVDDGLNFKYAERLIKNALWAVGGFKLTIFADKTLFARISDAYRIGGAREFDVKFFSNVYGVPFVVEFSEDVGESVPEYIHIAKSGSGARLGIDVGGSDIKVAALFDGEVLFSEEYVWLPKMNADPDYHIEHIESAADAASKYLPRVDSVGVSSAGIYVDGETRVASLFVKVPEDEYYKVRPIYKNLGTRFGAPVTVANDGDVAAVAGAVDLGVNNLLAIAMGTSEAGGFLDKNDNLRGWLNELAFAPVAVNDDAEIDEWSGDSGVGAKYLSQDGVIALAEKAGIVFKDGMTPAEKLKIVQWLVENDDDKAEKVFSDVGSYLGFALLSYRDFYKFDNVLLMGRVVSGRGGGLILSRAREILSEYADGQGVTIYLPDEKSRRVGQAVAAAYL